MRKLILTERQYGKLKNLIIESEITKSFLIEQNVTIDNKTGSVTLNKDLKFKTTGGGREKEIQILGNNTKLYPTPKGNVGGKVSIKITNVGFPTPIVDNKSNVYFMCKTGELMNGKVKYKIADKDLVSEICKSVQIKKNLSTSFGVGSVGGGSGYTQKYAQKIKSDKGQELTIPKETGYAPKKDNSGASFRIGNSYGWFDCKTKNFVIDKVKYTNQVLADNISKTICKKTVVPDEKPINYGSGGFDTSTSSFDASRFDQYI